MSKLLITELEILGQPRVVTALTEEGKVVELWTSPRQPDSLLGNIYVGKVKNVVPQIGAAFVEIKGGVICYLSTKESEQPLFTNQKKDNKIKAGDEVLVQVCREQMKTKAYTVSSNLNFTGKYLVLTAQRCHLGLSSKLLQDDRERLRKWLEPALEPQYGLIVRTNAQNASKEEILRELEHLKCRWKRVMEISSFRTCYSLLEKSCPVYLQAIRDVYGVSLEEIVTDQTPIFQEIGEYLSDYQKEDVAKLRFYQDKLLPLSKLYSLEKALGDALKEKVWLPCGGFLVIQQTEAFVVIDVNTGKYSGKKKLQETFRKINLEAAKEIAVQLRLRNLSGIILVDFINMVREEHREELLGVFRKHVKKDPVHTVVVDMTKLNIVEVTRKKVRKSLEEEIKGGQ